MTWTAAMVQKFVTQTLRPVTLLQIDLTSPSSRTLKFSSVAWDGDPTFQPVIISSTSADDRAEFLSPGPVALSMTVRIQAQAKLAYQAANKRAIHALSDYQWEAAVATVWLVDETLDASHVAQQFVGVIDHVGTTRDEIVLSLLIDNGWNKEAIDLELSTALYANMPDGGAGGVLGPIVGNNSMAGMPLPWADPVALLEKAQKDGRSLVALKGSLVDPGIGTAKARVLFAGHQMKGVPGSDKERLIFMAGAQVPAVLEPTYTGGSGITEVNTSSEAGVTIDDEKMVAYAAILPIDVRTTGTRPNTAVNPRNALTQAMDQFADLNAGTGKIELVFVIPSVGSLGTILSVQVQVAHSGGGTGNLRVYPYDPATAGAGTVVTMPVASANPAIDVGTWDANWWTQNWDFGANNGHGGIDLIVDIAGGATGAAKIFWAVLVVKYRPTTKALVPAIAERKPSRWFKPAPPPKVDWMPHSSRGWLPHLGAGRPGVPGVNELEGTFFGNGSGAYDNGSGDFTGTASALIEKISDVIRWLLVRYGGVSLGAFETGATAFGSFTSARYLCRNLQPEDLLVAFQITSRMNLSDLISQLCEQTMCHVFVDPEDGKWKILPWRDGMPLDYAREIGSDPLSMLEFSAERTDRVELVQGVRVKWWRDVFRDREMFETYVTSATSGRGRTHPEQRDERCEIVSLVNNKFDWDTSMYTYSDTLTTAAYVPVNLAAHIQDKMRTHYAAYSVGHGASAKPLCWYGFGVKAGAGYWDKLDIRVGGTLFVATLDEGWVDDPHGLAAHASARLNATGSGRTFAITYNESTGKFDYAVTGGAWDIGGPDHMRSAWPLLGQIDEAVLGLGASGSFTGARYARRYYIAASGGITGLAIRFGSGAPHQVAHTVGWDQNDLTGASEYRSLWQVGNLESQCATLETQWKRKRQIDIPCWAVKSETVAIEIRQRALAMRQRSRIKVKFRTAECPDLKRLMTFKFSTAMDAEMPPPGIASWANLRLRVLERSPKVDRTRDFEFVAVEN